MAGNIAGVTAWLKERIRAEGGDPERETLTVIPVKTGELTVKDEKGGAWRVFRFVEDAYGLDHPESTTAFEETGRGFGCFQRRLFGYPASSLKEVIWGFHDTPERYRQLMKAVIEELKEGKGTQFDPALVDILLELISSGRIDVSEIKKQSEETED